MPTLQLAQPQAATLGSRDRTNYCISIWIWRFDLRLTRMRSACSISGYALSTPVRRAAHISDRGSALAHSEEHAHNPTRDERRDTHWTSHLVCTHCELSRTVEVHAAVPSGFHVSAWPWGVGCVEGEEGNLLHARCVNLLHASVNMIHDALAAVCPT